MFALERQKAKLSSLNARAEKHGEEHVPAADLTFIFDAPNDVLSEFHPSLKSSLYRAADANGDQAELIDTPGYLPKLKFPLMSGFKWDWAQMGGQLTVHHGTGGRSDIVLEADKVDGFRFEPMDGGTVQVTLRVAAKPDEKQIGKLFGMIQEECEISLTPPESSQKEVA